MPVRKLRNRWGVDINFRGRRIRRRSPLNTRAGAQQYEAMLRQALACGKSDVVLGRNRAAIESFGVAIDNWLATCVSAKMKPSAQRSYKMIARVHLKPHFGRRRLDEIKGYDIESYTARKLAGTTKKGLSKKTVNNHLAVLGSFFRSCHEWGWLKEPPKLKWMRVPRPDFDFLTFEESEQLLRENADTRWHDILLCALRTGMRRGELLALRWKDIDFERNRITVCRNITRGGETSPKNYRVRPIPMADDLRTALFQRPRDSLHVFSNTLGRPRSTTGMQKGIKAACKRAELRHIGWHALRHSFATQLLAAGVGIRAVQELLGHSTVEMTMRYAHLMESALDDAVILLGRATANRG